MCQYWEFGLLTALNNQHTDMPMDYVNGRYVLALRWPDGVHSKYEPVLAFLVPCVGDEVIWPHVASINAEVIVHNAKSPHMCDLLYVTGGEEQMTRLSRKTERQRSRRSGDGQLDLPSIQEFFILDLDSINMDVALADENHMMYQFRKTNAALLELANSAPSVAMLGEYATDITGTL